MKRMIFLVIIVICAAFFTTFIITDDLFVPDRGVQQIYESAILAITLAAIGITASRYYSDTTTNAALQELKKLESKLEQKIEHLESQFDQINNKRDGL
jgi:peptidoglycan hydrolase CwlO-like protein